jgi:hypothetical protein
MVYQPPANRPPGTEDERLPGPILNERPWPGRLPDVQKHIALVVVHHRGDHQVIWPHDRQRVRVSSRPSTLYDVDIALHQARMEIELPSSDHGCSFHAAITIQWRVLDPSAVIQHRVTKVAQVLSPHLVTRLRRITRSFDITDSDDAEDEVNAQLGSLDPDVSSPQAINRTMQEALRRELLGSEYGLWTRAVVHLSPDEAAIGHYTKMTKLNWAIAEETAQQRLRLLQDMNQQAIMEGRITIYRDIIARGDTDRFAFQLAHNPDDIAAIDEIIRQEQQANRRDTIDFVAHMVDSGVIERHEVGDQATEALHWLKEVTSRVLRDRDRQTELESPDVPQRRGRGSAAEGQLAGSPQTTVIEDTSGPDTSSSERHLADAVPPEDA